MIEYHEGDRIPVQVRWLIRRDMADVLSIENESFEFAWAEEDFLYALRQRNCIGMVAEHDCVIVGYFIYELHKSSLNVLNFAVEPDSRRHGVGQQMAGKLIDKLSQQRRTEIYTEVRESNVPAQLFLKSQGFRAVDILRGHYDDTTEDAYVMRYHINEHASNPLAEKYALQGGNRIVQYEGRKKPTSVDDLLDS